VGLELLSKNEKRAGFLVKYLKDSRECSPKRMIAIKILPVKDKMNGQSPSLTVKILIAG